MQTHRWDSIVCSGLSDVIGSWKIIEMSLPRTSRISVSLSASNSRPSSRTSPATIRPGGLGISRMMDSAVMLLPQPDSPTTAKVSPRPTEKDTSLTAVTTPCRVKNSVFRPETSSTGTLAAAGMEA